MEDKTKSSVGPGSCTGGGDHALYPPSYGWQPSLLYGQHFGLPPFLDFRDLSWMESVYRKLWTSSWSGYTRSVEFSPRPGLKFHREMGGGVSEVTTQGCKWRVSLDVNHFAPSEISVMTQAGFLVVGGKHDERQDEHGYISRCFLRKYKLPDGVESSSIHTFITGDGVLTVEVPLPDLPPAADSTITVQVEMESPKLDDLKTDERRRPGVTERGVVTGLPVEKPDGKPVGERVRPIDGAPEDLRYREGVAEEEAVRIREEDKKRKEEEEEERKKEEERKEKEEERKKKEEERKEKEEERKKKEEERKEKEEERKEEERKKKEEGAEERIDSVGVTDEVPGLIEELQPTSPQRPAAPQPAGMVTSEGGRRILERGEEREIQEREDGKPVQEPDVEGEPRHAKPDEEHPVPVQTQEEVHTQLDITEQRAIGLMRKSE